MIVNQSLNALFEDMEANGLADFLAGSFQYFCNSFLKTDFDDILGDLFSALLQSWTSNLVAVFEELDSSGKKTSNANGTLENKINIYRLWFDKEP